MWYEDISQKFSKVCHQSRQKTQNHDLHHNKQRFKMTTVIFSWKYPSYILFKLSLKPGNFTLSSSPQRFPDSTEKSFKRPNNDFSSPWLIFKLEHFPLVSYSRIFLNFLICLFSSFAFSVSGIIILAFVLGLLKSPTWIWIGSSRLFFGNKDTECTE